LLDPRLVDPGSILIYVDASGPSTANKKKKQKNKKFKEGNNSKSFCRKKQF